MATDKSKPDWRHWTIVAATVSVTIWVARRVKQMFTKAVNEKEARRAEKNRRREIRRKLRGLRDDVATRKEAA